MACDSMSSEKKSRLGFVRLHKLQGFFHKQIISELHRLGGVAAAASSTGVTTFGKASFSFVTPEKIGKMIMRMVLVEIAKKLVEALLAGQAGCGGADVAQAPFANERGAITALLQHLGNSDISWL